MARRLPPFTAIRAFEAAARHGSAKDAADELCVTPSAISHQIRLLEEYLDTGLFNRHGNRLRLTLTGRTYQGRLTTLLDDLEDSTESARRQSQPLRVLSTPGFAARWLVPRLDRLDFAEDIRLKVSQGAPDTDFAKNGADVVIHWGAEPILGAVVEPLMQSARYPVVSPELKEREGVEKPSDLLRMRLLHDEVMDAWDEWFLAAGLDPADMPRGPSFPHCEIATTAAERGQGISLAYDAMVRSTLKEGTLVRLFEEITMPVIIYSVAYTQSRASVPRIQAFRDWLFAEVKAEGTEAPDRIQAAE